MLDLSNCAGITTIIIDVLKIIVIPITAYLSIVFSLKKYFHEKSWERKSIAYSNVIESLHAIKRISNIWGNDELEGKRESRDERGKLVQEYIKAKNDFEKYIDIGALYFPCDVVKILRTLKDKQKEWLKAYIEDHEPLFELYHAESEASHKCLEQIIELAILDLKK
jgi:hypothetical protein